MSDRLNYLGGVMLGCGVLWVGVSWAKPGWNALRDALPVWAVNLEAGLVLSAFGAGLLGLGKVFSSPGRAEVSKNTGETQRERLDKGEDTDLWVQIGKDQLAAEKQALGACFGKSQKRVALRACWPQRPTQSWVGGWPKLPLDMEWPTLNGEPAVFLAQISLDDLPETTWQGAGPRQGWLVIWGDNEGGWGAVVRHVVGPVEECFPPDGCRPNWHWNMEPDGNRIALGEFGKTTARWFLEKAQENALGSVEDMMSENRDYYDENAGEWIWEKTWTSVRAKFMGQLDYRDDLRFGVDWPSLFGLVHVWRTGALKRQNELRLNIANGDQRLARAKEPHLAALQQLQENPGAEEASFERIKAQLSESEAKWRADMDRMRKEMSRIETALDLERQLDAEMRDFQRDTPFNVEIGQEILQALYSAYFGASAYVRPAIRHFMENYARYLYTLDPESLPEALFDAFAPLWEMQCDETLVFIGLNREGDSGMQCDARLIDLPPHPLAGLSFGDDSRFFVDLPMRDLVAENWQDAKGSTTHGIL